MITIHRDWVEAHMEREDGKPCPQGYWAYNASGHGEKTAIIDGPVTAVPFGFGCDGAKIGDSHTYALRDILSLAFGGEQGLSVVFATDQARNAYRRTLRTVSDHEDSHIARQETAMETACEDGLISGAMPAERW